jgi:hypothetical protein
VRSSTQGRPRHAGRAAVASRILAAVVGGWCCAWGFVMLCLALGRRAGLAYADAQTLAWLLVFPLWVAAICWSFAAASGARVWLALAGGGALMAAAGWWLLRLPA